MAPALAKETLYTVAYIYSLPEGSRAELIDGQIYDMAPPSRMHQRLTGELFAMIREYLHQNNGSCEVDLSPFAVFLNEDDFNYVEPDISVICDPHKLTDKGCLGAPDWIIEVVSPGSRRMDYFTKLFKYRTSGVREYWIVDPDKNRILVYNFDSEDTGDYTFADSVKAGIYEDLYIDFCRIAKQLGLP
ncbi:MAG: Uma2 family endonuclease [Lachnospiraceae bacterium]|nr:Uma2 family endonuclease [Lachnospiraceae bacterium]MCI9150337.1 Uma2 family endonuclease [Lachnospiraceae bacterium]